MNYKTNSIRMYGIDLSYRKRCKAYTLKLNLLSNQKQQCQQKQTSKKIPSRIMQRRKTQTHWARLSYFRLRWSAHSF